MDHLQVDQGKLTDLTKYEEAAPTFQHAFQRARVHCERRSSLMLIAFESKLSDPCRSLSGRFFLGLTLGKALQSHIEALSTQVYKCKE